MKTLGCALLMLGCLVLGAARADGSKTVLTHETLWMMKRLGAPVVSPDGKWTVYSVIEPNYDPDKAVSDLWLVANDGKSEPKRLTDTKAAESGVAFSPDSKRIAFATKREGDEVEQIYLMALDGGEARRLTNVSTGASEPVWRPDGAAILFQSQVFPGALDEEANKKAAKELKERKYNVRTYEHFPVRFWNRWLDERVPTLMVQGVNDTQAKDILSASAFARQPGFSGSLSDSGVSLAASYSPDGSEVLFLATTARWSAAYAEVPYRLYRMRSQGGEPKPVVEIDGDYEGATFSADGRALYYLYAPHNQEVYNQPRLYRVGWPDPGTPQAVTGDFDGLVNSFALSSDSKSAYLLVAEASHQNLYRVAGSGGRPERLIAPAVGGYSALGVAQKSARAVVVGSYGSSVSPSEVVAIDLARKSHVNLTHVNTALAAGIDWAPPQHFYFTSTLNRSIHSMIVLPPKFDPAKKYPALVLIHGGAASNNPDQIGLRWNYHLLAAPGYVIIMTDYTGSTSFGEKFARAIKLDPLKTPGNEINQAVDEALKRYAFIDADKLCAAGASYGGHLANWIEATTTRYRCIISHAGEVDLTAQWGTSDAIYGREVTNGGPPWAGNPVWREQSPLSYADHWKTPMLLSVGEKDFRVPINNALENWSALQRMHVPSRLLVWPDAGHWILKPEDSRHFYEEVHRWLGIYLKGSGGAASSAE